MLHVITFIAETEPTSISSQWSQFISVVTCRLTPLLLLTYMYQVHYSRGCWWWRRRG